MRQLQMHVSKQQAFESNDNYDLSSEPSRKLKIKYLGTYLP